MNFPSNRFHAFRVDLSSSGSPCRLRFSEPFGGGDVVLEGQGVNSPPHYGRKMNLCEIRLDRYWLVIIIIIVDLLGTYEPRRCSAETWNSMDTED
ncbi:hypothetical protein CDAR_519291 [Caerostris darwini]|uniref:Uncharacterized protein n=1 Tax=Caerostris darwini TaxID=1538125 RepID=A0AAV4PMS6_9ARAC|nr:hypothetical protein CDAR_519291 [Caerostris darwini]